MDYRRGQGSSVGELLKYHNIDEFAQLLASKNLLVFDKGDTKQKTTLNLIEDIERENKSDFLCTFKEFVDHAFKHSIELYGKIAQPYDSGSDSSSSFSFSDESHCSQAIPDVTDKISLPQDPGYFTSSNSSGTCPPNEPNKIRANDQLIIKHQEKQSQQAKARVSQTKKKKHSTVNVCNNYYNNTYVTSPVGSSAGQARDSQFNTETAHNSFSTVEYGHTIKFKDILKICNKELTEWLDVPNLLPYLHEQNLITEDDCDDLMLPTRTRKDRNRHLLHILPSKGVDACSRFIKCLSSAQEHLGHQDLVKLLKHHIKIYAVGSDV